MTYWREDTGTTHSIEVCVLLFRGEKNRREKKTSRLLAGLVSVNSLEEDDPSASSSTRPWVGWDGSGLTVEMRSGLLGSVRQSVLEQIV